MNNIKTFEGFISSIKDYLKPKKSVTGNYIKRLIDDGLIELKDEGFNIKNHEAEGNILPHSNRFDVRKLKLTTTIDKDCETFHPKDISDTILTLRDVIEEVSGLSMTFLYKDETRYSTIDFEIPSGEVKFPIDTYFKKFKNNNIEVDIPISSFSFDIEIIL